MTPHEMRRAAQALVLVLLTGCGGDTPTPMETPVPTSISISPGSADFTYLNETRPLTARVLDQNGDELPGAVVWTSDDPSVVSVGATGIARAVSNGATSIVAVSAGLTATAAVTVQQVASLVVLLSGGTQEAVAGFALANAIVVATQDRLGSPVGGTTVTFSPDPTHGSVSAITIVAEANGEAATTWTLGTPFGPQCLKAAITGGAEVTISAIARSATPTPNLVSGNQTGGSGCSGGGGGGTLTVIRADPTSLETVTVQMTIQNDGDAGTGGGFRVQLLADGVEIASADLPALPVGAEVAVEFVAGPFTPGSHVLSIVADADDVIVELDETDNEVSKTQFVTLQTSVSAGVPVTGLGGVTDSELLFRLDIPPGSPGLLTITLSGGTGDVDLYIEGANRPSAFPQYDDCRSLNTTTAETCQIVSASGTYHIALHAFSTYSGTTMDITLGGDVIPFNIELVFLDNGTAAQNAAFQAAADRWTDIIVGDVFDVDFSGGEQEPYPADLCIEGQAAVSDVIDDIRIYVSIVSIDGVGGVLGQAGPCALRGITHIPTLGSMQFDQADLEKLELDGDMLEVVLHEMGHVLGIGTIWSRTGHLQNPSLPPDPLPPDPGVDTHFNGVLAIAAFDAAGGASYSGGEKVPVENSAGPGSADGHWRESVLDNELMTPFLDALMTNPL
ncbi:MAG: Ig-like domain-containing protein, partial [Gemmatimonadetes bacterium]|nr:Ig-like domain-containing protein [Gemmatimonadota bacterium]